MNEFTKEELEMILSSIEFDMHTYKPSDNGFNHNLCIKLRLMIEGYCEHELVLVGCDGNAYPQCFKCDYIPEYKKIEPGGSR
jgi:hypothetical protein